MKKQILAQSDTAILCRELALLYHAGVEPAGGLLLLAEDCADKKLKNLLEELASRLDEGSTLSAALEESGAFPHYMCGLIRVGEETGRLEDALEALAQYYSYQVQLSRRMRAALSYPLLLMAVMLIVVVVLLTKVLPMVTTDLSDSEIFGYAVELFPLLTDLQISTMRIPGDGTYQLTMIKEMSVLLPNLEANRQLLAEIMAE